MLSPEAITQTLSWLTPAGSVLVMWLLGSKRRIGWAFSLGNQVMWVALGYYTGATGFYASAVVFSFLAIRGWIRWKPTSPPPTGEVNAPK